MGEAASVSGTFVVEHLVIQGGDDGGGQQAVAREKAGAGEQAVDGPTAMADEEEPPSSAMVGVGEQSPLAVAHSPLPKSPMMVG